MINLAIMYGYMFQDPKQKYTSQGVLQTTFTLKCTEKFVHKGEKKENTEWVRCVYYGPVTDDVLHSKGRDVMVEGRVETYSYDKDGTKQYQTQVNCSKVKVVHEVKID